MDRYEQLANTFVGLADTLVADYDVVEFAQRLVDNLTALLPVSSAGIMLGDANGRLHVFASSSEHTRLLELLQVEANAGPCLESYVTRNPVLVPDIPTESQRWPAFAERAAEYGFAAVFALPLRLRDERIGAVNLFRTEPGALSEGDLAVGQGLADVAAVGILHQRILTRAEIINQQLQSALNSRTIIEQAKGVLAERGSIGMDESFVLLRSHARRTNQRLADLARTVVGGADTTTILNPGAAPQL
ncbi:MULTISPECIES: GAF and ANTAR domain-containing protein [Mycolicibacterium]|uniref:GAF and ANTAR domain-containing protein n=1 Tax=Mycolicibacterium porcinum TaxID=39693 RepID=A0ABV3VBE8_9MYCO|nr:MULTISPECIES: GAF and ANTAR domain-containing protein [Mycolicibacterium]QRY52058.1 GAF and ANTAR domain-containing protein [Mycolicibacterium septicum]